MQNTQLIEKYVRDDPGTLLQVKSVFHTIQGEGPFCGTPAVFIRLAGCNLQCPGCDTDYTSNRFTASPQTLYDMVAEMQRGELVVITGGEPFRQNISVLTHLLLQNGYYVQIETNGTLPPPEYFITSKDINARDGVYVVCSPKTGKVNPVIAAIACCYKYVLSHDSINRVDGLPLHALGHPATPHVARPPSYKKFPVYLQPMDTGNAEENELNLRACVNSCMKYGYILQLQIHKLINME